MFCKSIPDVPRAGHWQTRLGDWFLQRIETVGWKVVVPPFRFLCDFRTTTFLLVFVFAVVILVLLGPLFPLPEADPAPRIIVSNVSIQSPKPKARPKPVKLIVHPKPDGHKKTVDSRNGEDDRDGKKLEFTDTPRNKPHQRRPRLVNRSFPTPEPESNRPPVPDSRPEEIPSELAQLPDVENENHSTPDRSPPQNTQVPAEPLKDLAMRDENPPVSDTSSADPGAFGSIRPEPRQASRRVSYSREDIDKILDGLYSFLSSIHRQAWLHQSGQSVFTMRFLRIGKDKITVTLSDGSVFSVRLNPSSVENVISITAEGNVWPPTGKDHVTALIELTQRLCKGFGLPGPLDSD